MSKGINQVRKSIMKRRKSRQNTLENKLINNNLPSLPEEEEKHGYLPTYFGEIKSNAKRSHIFSSKFNVILLKVIASFALFIGAHIIVNANSTSLEKPKEVVLNVLTENFPFARMYVWYEETFGIPLAFTPTNSKYIKNISVAENGIALPVNGTITEPFEHNGKGVFITPSETSNVTAWREGMIIFAGNDRQTNKTIIIQHEDKSKTIYGNLSSIDAHLYQFVSQHQMIGTISPTHSEETFYFALQKNNEFIDPFQVIQVDDGE